MTFIFGRQGFFGYSGADTGCAMWWSNLFREREFTAEDLNVSTESLKRELLERFGRYVSPVPELISRTANVLRLNVYDVRSLPAWQRGRIVLTGGAAHAVSPNARQRAAPPLA